MPAGRAYLSTAGPHWRKAGCGSSLEVTPNYGVAAEGEARSTRLTLIALLWVALLLPAVTTAAEAADDRIIRFDITRQRADKALIEFAEQTDVTFIFPVDEARKVTANAVRGEFTPKEAIGKLLNGTGLRPRFQADGALTVDAEHSWAGKGDSVKNRGLFASIIAALAASTAVDVKADQASESETTHARLEGVIVTATRRAESLQEIPLSVTAIDENLLVKAGAIDFIDYATRAPNLSFGSTRDTALGSYSMQVRGIAGNGTTGFYIDDVPIALAMNPRVMDISRIEVLRGPQGSLYGARSMGGTVRLITKRADPTSREFVTHATLGDVAEGGSDYAADAAINIPISSNAAFRGNLYYQRESGVHDIAVDNPTVAGDEITRKNADEGEYWGIQAMITWHANERFTVEPRFMYQKSHIDWIPYSDDSPDNFTSRRVLDLAEPQELEWSIGSLTLTWDTDWGSFTSATAYMQNELDSSEEFSEFMNFFSGALGGDPNYYPPGGSLMTRNEYTSQFTEEVRFVSDFSGRLQVTTGIFYSNNSRDLLLPCSFALGFSDATGFPFGTDCVIFAEIDTKVEETAFFGELEYAIADNLFLTVGGRFFDNSFENSRFQSGMLVDFGAPPGPRNDTEQNEDGFNPKVALKWNVNDNWTLYSSAAKGFRIGGTNNPLPVEFCAADMEALGISPGSASTFDSDSLWNFEIGSKSTHAGGRFSFNTAVFFIDWEDIIQATQLPCGFGFTNNTGKAESKGVEIEISGRPTYNLTYNLGVGYTDAKITDPESATGVFKGDPLTQVPEWTFTSNAEYRFNVGAHDAFVFLSYRWIDDSISTNQGIARPRERDSYEVLDARVGMNFGNAVVSLFGKNLTNEHANLADARALAAYPPGLTRYAINRPRTIGIDVRWQF